MTGCSFIAGPSPAALVSVMSLDPFADMAPLMPESSWPAAALDPFAEALQPAPTAAAATPAAIPAAPVDKLATSPTGASDDGFGSFNEAAAPGSFFPASPVATLGVLQQRRLKTSHDAISPLV